MIPELQRVTIITETADGKVSAAIMQIKTGGEIIFDSKNDYPKDYSGRHLGNARKNSLIVTELGEMTVYKETPAIAQAAAQFIATVETKQPRDPRIEAVAEAIYLQNASADDSGPYAPFSENKKEYYRAKAVAALAAADGVDLLRKPGYKVEIAGNTWTVQHPPECRPDLLHCPIMSKMYDTDPTCFSDGVWNVELTDEGELEFTWHAPADR